MDGYSCDFHAYQSSQVVSNWVDGHCYFVLLQGEKMKAPSISWPNFSEYTIENVGSNRIKIHGKRWFTWYTFHLIYHAPDSYSWEHNGNVLHLAPHPVWLALRLAAVDPAMERINS
jgi:hypothetical protein